MSTKMTSDQDVETTDILAHKYGAFEKYDLVSVCTTDIESVLSKEKDKIRITSPTESNYLILKFESIDGNEIIFCKRTEQIIFCNQQETIKQIIENGYAYIYDGEVPVITSNHERANIATKEYNFDKKITTSDILFDVIQIFYQNMQIRFGSRTYRTVEQKRSDIIRTYERDLSCDIPNTNISEYLNFISSIPENPTKAEIIDVKSNNILTIFVNGSEFDIEFEGRPTSNDHTPTALAEKLGVRTPENLQNESIMIGLERYCEMPSRMNPVGKNKSGILAIGTKD